jgi:hypothetical protein
MTRSAYTLPAPNRPDDSASSAENRQKGLHAAICFGVYTLTLYLHTIGVRRSK